VEVEKLSDESESDAEDAERKESDEGIIEDSAPDSAAAPARSFSAADGNMIAWLNDYIADYGVTGSYPWTREQKRCFEGALFSAAIQNSWSPQDSIKWIKKSFLA
jgi:hypothetical protein